jgi:hypothetical protein
MATNAYINTSIHNVTGFAAIIDAKSLAAEARDSSQIENREIVPAGVFRIRTVLEDGSMGPEFTFFVPSPEIAEAYADAINACSRRLREQTVEPA